MNTKKVLGLSACALIWAVSLARGQPARSIGKVKEYVDQDVERHRWEFNINTYPLIEHVANGPLTYPYILKLNARPHKKPRAWRFLASPYVNMIKQVTIPDTTNRSHGRVNNSFWEPMLAIGHEWQRVSGRATAFGGCDLATHFSRSKAVIHDQLFTDDDGIVSRGTEVMKFHHDLFWIATFVGARIALNHRIEVSLESHFLVSYSWDTTISSFNDKQISYSQSTFLSTIPRPFFMINLGYCF